MSIQELLQRLREDLEWAEDRKRELPIPLIDDLKEAIDLIEVLMTEDMGLEPEEIRAYLNFFEDLIGNQRASEALDYFRNLAQADKEGRVHILPKSENGTCGSCAHFRRIVGTCSGRCDIRPYPVDRWGNANLHGGAFMPAQSRKACKHYLTHEEAEQALERSRGNE